MTNTERTQLEDELHDAEYDLENAENDLADMEESVSYWMQVVEEIHTRIEEG